MEQINCVPPVDCPILKDVPEQLGHLKVSADLSDGAVEPDSSRLTLSSSSSIRLSRSLILSSLFSYSSSALAVSS